MQFFCQAKEFLKGNPMVPINKDMKTILTEVVSLCDRYRA